MCPRGNGFTCQNKACFIYFSTQQWTFNLLICTKCYMHLTGDNTHNFQIHFMMITKRINAFTDAHG